jgi:mRNA interferase MazF
LVRFVLADEQGEKRRPVLVLSTDAYHVGRAEVVVAAITGNVGRMLPGDCPIRQWRQAGLARPSVATGILRTIKGRMIDTRLGALSATDLKAVEACVRTTLGV